MTGPITVMIAHQQATERERLRRLLAEYHDIQVIGEAKDDQECLDSSLRQHPHVLLLQEDIPNLGGLNVAEQLATRTGNVAIILMLTNPAGEEMWHKMLRVGIREFFTRSTPSEQLVEEIRRIVGASKSTAQATGPRGEEKPRNQVITIAAPRGGTGKSVIATNLAVALAGCQESVTLLDLNLIGGDVAVLLDLVPQRTLGDLLPTFGGIDQDVMDSLILKHSSGLSVLPSPLSGTFDSAVLSRPLVQGLLRFLRERSNHTVVDTGYPSLESTLAAMDSSDIILVVVGNDLPRLRDGKQYLRNLVAANYPKERIRVLVNRTGLTKEIASKEIESILEFPVTAQLPNDDEIVGVSVNLGQPFVITSPGKQLSKAMISLAESFLLNPAQAHKKRKSVFSFLA